MDDVHTLCDLTNLSTNSVDFFVGVCYSEHNNSTPIYRVPTRNRKRGIPMKNTPERQKDIISIIASLDISPTMYRNADEKYKAITKFLDHCGIEADMYPQGSFAFGTVVRPVVKNSSASYDLDFICQVKGNRSEHTPSELRRKIEIALTSSDVYGGKMTIYEECFTIEYADINGISFSIDIVPAVDENDENKNRLSEKSLSPELTKTAIAIPRHNGERNYSWLTNNPKGVRKWFDEINQPFLAASRETYRQYLFEENRSVYSSVEDIPLELERSALQRVIQILKYHRDVYYATIKDGAEIKPISAILNVVATQISEHYTPNCSVFELLEFVLSELAIYASQQNLTFKEFEQTYGNRAVFSRPNGKWCISNPANPEDNLADKWNQDSRIAGQFFRWANAISTDFVTSLRQVDDQQFRIILENGLGSTVVSSVLGHKYSAKITPKPIPAQGAAKPYMN